jgi:hypothetical protein
MHERTIETVRRAADAEVRVSEYSVGQSGTKAIFRIL